jgi:acetoin utilization deacetylase AcuC-like enzyme
MTTLIIHHDECLLHDTGPRHPECPQRVSVVLAALKDLPRLEFLPAPRAEEEQLSRVHPLPYVDAIRAAEPEEGRVAINEDDNLMSPGSYNAALRGAGSICFAIDQLFEGKGRNAFCVVRPPGHHAEAELAMGFCLFNNVAVGARHALAVHGIERVAILDFDVHHGNGTQAIFEDDPSVLFISSHQIPLYPGGGFPDETGVGNIINLPLPPESGSGEFRHAWSGIALPALRAFEPELILVSAGFDAHAGDPLGQLELHEDDYAWITAEFRRAAEEFCGGRLVSILEGGYNLDALASSARAHVEALGPGAA